MKTSFNRFLMLMGGVLFSIVLLEAALQFFAVFNTLHKTYRNRVSFENGRPYTILCLGESTTDNQYPEHLERELNARAHGTTFKVIDKGKAGTRTDYIMWHLEKYLDEYNPDMVVAMMGKNDNWDDLVVYEIQPAKWYKRFRVYKLCKMVCFQINNISADRRNSTQQDSDKPYRQKYNGIVEVRSTEEKELLTTGGVYLGRKMHREAEGMFAKAIALNPRNQMGYMGLSAVYYDQQRLQDAENALQKAIEVSPLDDKAYVLLGELYRRTKRFREAEAIYNRYLQQCKKNAGAGIASQVANGQSEDTIAVRSLKAEEISMTSFYGPSTKCHYGKLIKSVLARRIKLVCVQYPRCSLSPLVTMAGANNGIVFVDNEKRFNDVVAREGYSVYFLDKCYRSSSKEAMDFGHCTEKGNKLLAGNIADAILLTLDKNEPCSNDRKDGSMDRM